MLKKMNVVELLLQNKMKVTTTMKEAMALLAKLRSLALERLLMERRTTA